MICKSSRPPTGCAHAAKLLEYWENRQILENLEPSNTFKAKAIFETTKKTIFFRLLVLMVFHNFVCVPFWSKFVTLAHGGCFLILLLFWAGESKSRASRALFQSWPLLKFFSDQKVCRTNFCQQPPQLDKSLNKLGQKTRKSKRWKIISEHWMFVSVFLKGFKKWQISVRSP